jgi:hypothetical protein
MQGLHLKKKGGPMVSNQLYKLSSSCARNRRFMILWFFLSFQFLFCLMFTRLAPGAVAIGLGLQDEHSSGSWRPSLVQATEAQMARDEPDEP